jgi:hypothetical protein
MLSIIQSSNFKVIKSPLTYIIDVLSYSHLETMLFSGLEENKNS